ncbi:MAG: MlaD family protein [Pirellulales bacterium]|nr:MlaD family protein [Pirellulales bacterium]
MEDRSKQFKVGVVVVATILVTSLLVVLTSDFTWSPFRNQYQLQVLVDQAPGVAPETPVRRRGILIGRVADVVDTDDGALITIDVDEGKHVKSNEVARIQTSLIGDAVVEFTPGPPSAEAQIVQPGGEPLRGMYNPSPLDLIANLQGDLKQTIQSLGRAGDEVAELAERMNSIMGGQDVERIDRLLTTTETALENFGNVMADIEDVTGDEQFKIELKNGLAQLPSLIEDTKIIMEALERAVSSADQNLVNLQGLTEPLGERGPEIVDSLEAGVDNLSELLGEAALLAKNINKSDGTIGKLINDDELYRQLASTIGQASSAVRDVRMLINDPMIQRRIRQILDDVRVFTDKIARDPARVARGIIPKNREIPLK